MDLYIDFIPKSIYSQKPFTMKRSLFFLLTAILLFALQPARSQEFYPISSWENLFQWADIEGTPQNNQNITERLRYTLVLNIGQYWHVDFTNFLGIYSGLAIRNVGFIYDTDIPTKTIRRSYNLGVPLALKLGAFNKNFYIFGGGEYELLFHYKGKRWNSNNRDGAKTKQTEWFSPKTKRFVPSVFAGIQMPGGFNIKYKFYLEHFLNSDFTGTDFNTPGVSFADNTAIDMHYISICWQFRTDQWKNYVPSDKVAQNF